MKSRAFVSGFLILLLSASVHAEDNQDLPLGPVGGVGRLSPGQNYIRVTSVTAGAPGAVAGLKASDFIHGAFGQEFGTTGGSGITGAELDFGQAIERAESGNGQLPLQVLRPGIGELTLTVALPVVGGFGPAYPLNSPKFDLIYNQSCQRIHEKIQAGNVDTYLHSWAGLGLLGHPNWNDTAGARPYRNSINKIKNAVVGLLGTNAQYAPVEDRLYDGSANPNFVDSGLESWGLGSAAMFLAEYRAKTGDTSVDTVIQRTAELLANRVQWWKQPDLGTGYSPSGAQIAGMISHGGVTGDYIHIGWGGGINIVGVHVFSGLALSKRAGANMTSRPRDGHYFGFADPPAGAVAPGMEYYDHTLDEKFNLCWEWMAGRCAYYSAGNFHDGHVCYTLQGSSAYDAAGRTAGTLYGMLAYADSAALSPTNQVRVNSLKGYLVRNYARLQECHAYTHGGQVFYQLCAPYLDDRGQRYFLENWRSYYNLSRNPNGSVAWVPGRNMTDVYLDLEMCGQTYGALPATIAKGGLPHVPGYNTNRLLASFRSPWVAWPSLDARHARLTNTSHAFQVDICDGLGNILSNGYTASWAKLSGPGTVTFGNPNTNSTKAIFSLPGRYRIQLSAARGTNLLTEPLDVDVPMASPPAGFVMGQFPCEVFTGISGGNISQLTSSAKYINNQPDITSSLTSLEGIYTGDSYGQRLRGFIVPPVTGSYRFYIASDDSSQFRFSSTGTNPAAATLIASVGDGNWTDRYQWNKYSSQASGSYSLTAGQPYYFEVLHKEGSGGDHLAVAWTGPGMTTTNLISGLFLATRPELAITRQPVSVATALGSNATFNVSVRGIGPILYQWRLNGTPYWTPGSDSVLTLSSVGGGMAGSYDCIITTPYGVVTSLVATLTITNAGSVIAGGLWREVYTGIGGNNISDLTNQSVYPRFSSASGVINTSEAPSNYDDSYGQRWTGWIKPGLTGNYRFYVASDDGCELWLSTTEYATHRARITGQGGYASPRAWNSPSGYYPLEAGKRYYVEFLHKDGGGGDNSAFTWQRQGEANPTNGAPPIDGAYLEYRLGGIYPETYAAPPLAVNDTLGVVTGSSWTQDVVANDIDSDNASLRVLSVSTPAHGTAVTNTARTVTYTPQAGYQGGDSFTYVVQNSASLTATGTVTVTVSDPYSGLAGWWRVDETAGTTAADSIGGRHGTYIGSPTLGQPGMSAATGTSVRFDGASQHVSIPGFTTPSLLTISAWVKPDVLSGDRPIFTQNASFALKINGSALRLTTPGVKDHDTGALPLSTTQWNFVAVTFQPGGNCKFYLNGNLVGTVAASSLTPNANAYWIARSQWGVYFDGFIDDVRLSSRILSDAEIQALYSAMATVPVCVLTSPAPGAVINTNNIALSAAVTPNGNTINRVEFLNGTTVVGTVLSPPYTFNWLTAAPGYAQIRARAWFSPANYSVDSTASTVLVNAAPVFTNSLLNLAAAQAGTPYTGTLAGSATDPNAGQALTFSKEGGPSWLLLASNGALSGTPDVTQVGTNNFPVRVTDPYGLTGDATAQIVVTSPPSVPITGTLSLQGGNLILSWSGGIPPYQVQSKTNLSDVSWIDYGAPTSSQSIIITPTEQRQFFRIRSP